MNVTARAFLSAVLLVLPMECLAADLTIMAEDAAPPFSQADGTGYANEVVKAAFRAAGVDVALDVVPYARCKRDVADGKVPACFAMSWYKGVEAVVTFSQEPIFQVYADVFVPRKSAGRSTQMADFGRGTTIGIVNEYEYPDEIYALRSNGAALQASANDLANLKMLAAGRIDAAVVMTNDLVPQTSESGRSGGRRRGRVCFPGRHRKVVCRVQQKEPARRVGAATIRRRLQENSSRRDCRGDQKEMAQRAMRRTSSVTAASGQTSRASA
jgi:ABC-type amino acid transport substrate-binding protein